MQYYYNLLLPLLVLLLITCTSVVQGQIILDHSRFNGDWVINEELSDDTDKQVEKAIRDAGSKIPRTGKKGKGRYRGGPKEQAIYDHISYDDKLTFQYNIPEFKLEYEEGFERIFYSDNRKRVVSASGTIEGDKQDFSFATWDENTLLVESRPRDGGWIFETYEMDEGETRLILTLELKPSSFAEPIHLIRIYDNSKLLK